MENIVRDLVSGQDLFFDQAHKIGFDLTSPVLVNSQRLPKQHVLVLQMKRYLCHLTLGGEVDQAFTSFIEEFPGLLKPRLGSWLIWGCCQEDSSILHAGQRTDASPVDNGSGENLDAGFLDMLGPVDGQGRIMAMSVNIMWNYWDW